MRRLVLVRHSKASHDAVTDLERPLTPKGTALAGMLEAAGLGVAFCAKPVVVEQADAAIHVRDLRAVLQLIGG